MDQCRPRPVSTTCSASSRPRAKRKTMYRRGKEHLSLLRQKSASLSQILHRVPRAQTKSHKKTLENLETRKKADLFCTSHNFEDHVRAWREPSIGDVALKRPALDPHLGRTFSASPQTPSLTGTKLVSSFHQPMNSLNRLVLSRANVFPVSVFIILSNLSSFSMK